jgi:hypothetical protein
VATDRELWVEALWENAKKKSLKSSKPEQPKQPGTVDLWEDTCHQITGLWVKPFREKQRVRKTEI